MSIQQHELREPQDFRADETALAPVSDGRDSLTRAQLSEALVRRIGVSRPESAQMIEMVLDEICDALSCGERVKLPGFGTFEVRSKAERVGRNPKTGVDAKIAARKVVSFKPSYFLRQKVNDDRVCDFENPALAAAG